MKNRKRKPHTRATKKKMRESRIGRFKGKNHPQWKGGIKKHGKGYLLYMVIDHPFADASGYVLAHRLVVEAQIKRYLLPVEIVHHINRIKNDNRPVNLMAFINNSSHQRYEQNKVIDKNEIIFDGNLLKRRSM
jgi:hypothetical protein